MLRMILLLAFAECFLVANLNAQIGVGANVPADAHLLFDGSRQSLESNWTYWEGPRFSSTHPIKWLIVKDPVDEGTVVNSNDPAAEGGLYGAADIVTKNKYRDFRLHVEFLITNPGGGNILNE